MTARKPDPRFALLVSVLLVTLLFLSLPAGAAAPAGSWWDTAWHHRRQLLVSTFQTEAIPQYQALFEGESIRIRPVVQSDPSGYSYSVVDSPGTSSWDAATGTWTWTTTYYDAGAHTVTFRATEIGNPSNIIDLSTQINVYPDMSPSRWEKHDPDNGPYADPVMVAESTWEGDSVRDPALAVYAETGEAYTNTSGEYLMYYAGGSSAGGTPLYQIGLATSTDLVTWTKSDSNPVLTYGASGTWDADKVVPGSVLVMPDGTFRLYYSAVGEGDWGSLYRIGLATSDDGVVWERHGDNPILDYGLDYDNISIPYVIMRGTDDWLMAFEGGGTELGAFVAGLATSTDGIAWTLQAPGLIPTSGAWDSGSVANPKLWKLDEHMYLMGYDGATGSDYKLGLALSFDGDAWTKYSENPILVGDYWLGAGVGVGDGYRVEGLQLLKSQFGQNHMDMLYFGGDASGPHDFRMVLATMDIPEPVPPADPTYLTRGAIYEDFASAQPIVNDIGALEAGYTVNLGLDTAALVGAGQMLANGDDLRVVYWDGAAWLELDRVAEDMETDHTRVWFMTEDAILGSDDNYYLYYGNPSAEAAPADWSAVYEVGDSFAGGGLATGLTASAAGGATLTESGGELVVDMDTTSGYAAIVSTPIDPGEGFAVGHRVKYVSGSGGMNFATVVQNASQPVVTNSTAYNTTRRILFYQYTPGSVRISYCEIGPCNSGTWHRWDGSDWDGPSTDPSAPLNVYYLAEFVSDGSQFWLVLRNAAGGVVTQTTPIPWSDVQNVNDDPYWLLWGEPYTNAYYADAASDYFYLRRYQYPEPVVEVAAETIGLFIWDGGGTGDGWSEGLNWQADSAPTSVDYALFNGTSTANSDVDASFPGTIGYLTVDAGYGSGVISQNRGLTITTGFEQSGGTFDCGADPLLIGGDFTLSGGAFNHNDGSVVFGGSGRQTVYGTPAFGDLQVSSGVTLVIDSEVTLAGALSNLGAIEQTKVLPPDDSVSYAIAGVTATSQPGDDSFSLTAVRIDSAHPEENHAGGGNSILDRYTILRADPESSSYTLDLCFSYTDAEVGVLGVDEGNLRLCRWTGTAWGCPIRGTGSDVSTNLVCADGVTQLSDWVIGATGPTAISLQNLATSSVPSGFTVLFALAGLLTVASLVALRLNRRHTG